MSPPDVENVHRLVNPRDASQAAPRPKTTLGNLTRWRQNVLAAADLRWERVMRVRRAVRAGAYDTEAMPEPAETALLDDIGPEGEFDAPPP